MSWRLQFSVLALGLISALVLSGCSRDQTRSKIVHVFHQADSHQVQVLYTKTRQKVSCPIGAHGCTYETKEQDLYHVTLPLETGAISEAELVNISRLVRSGTNQIDFSYYQSNQSMVFGNAQPQVLELHRVEDSKSDGLSTLEIIKSDESDRSQVVLGDSGRTFLWNDSLYDVASLNGSALDAKPGYQRFIAGVKALQESDSTSSSVKFYLFTDQTLLAKATYASTADAPLGIIYDIEEDKTSWLDKAFDGGGASVSVQAVRYAQNEFYFLLNFVDFENGSFTKTMDASYLYGSKKGVRTPIQSINYREHKYVWDVSSRVFFEITMTSDNAIYIDEVRNY